MNRARSSAKKKRSSVSTFALLQGAFSVILVVVSAKTPNAQSEMVIKSISNRHRFDIESMSIQLLFLTGWLRSEDRFCIFKQDENYKSEQIY